VTPCTYPPNLGAGEIVLAQGDAADVPLWRTVAGNTFGVLFAVACYYALYRLMLFRTDLPPIAIILIVGSFLLLQFLVFGLMILHPDHKRCKAFILTDRAIYFDHGWRLAAEDIRRILAMGTMVEDHAGRKLPLPGRTDRRQLRKILKRLIQ
jgi:hypothetical protein